MARITFEIRGYNRVQNNLRRMATQMDRELDPIVNQWARETRSELKSTPYPPKRPGQTYIRTGRLANSWGVQREGFSRYDIRNSALYAHYVVADSQGRDQAWMHQGRWWIARDIIQERAKELTRKLAKHIEREWEKGGD